MAFQPSSFLWEQMWLNQPFVVLQSLLLFLSRGISGVWFSYWPWGTTWPAIAAEVKPIDFFNSNNVVISNSNEEASFFSFPVSLFIVFTTKVDWSKIFSPSFQNLAPSLLIASVDTVVFAIQMSLSGIYETRIFLPCANQGMMTCCWQFHILTLQILSDCGYWSLEC